MRGKRFLIVGALVVAALYFYTPPLATIQLTGANPITGLRLGGKGNPTVVVSSSKDCDVVRAAVVSQYRKPIAEGYALRGEGGADLRCRWSVDGRPMKILNNFDLRAMMPKAGKMMPVGWNEFQAMSASAPRYSVLGTWATIDIGLGEGESGSGETCSVAWVIGGWKTVSCRNTWIA